VLSPAVMDVVAPAVRERRKARRCKSEIGTTEIEVYAIRLGRGRGADADTIAAIVSR
jgi:hypothetical protein